MKAIITPKTATLLLLFAFTFSIPTTNAQVVKRLTAIGMHGYDKEYGLYLNDSLDLVYNDAGRVSSWHLYKQGEGGNLVLDYNAKQFYNGQTINVYAECLLFSIFHVTINSTYYINDGLITHVSLQDNAMGETTITENTYCYDNDRRMISATSSSEDGTFEAKCTWQNDNLTQIDYYQDGEWVETESFLYDTTHAAFQSFKSGFNVTCIPFAGSECGSGDEILLGYDDLWGVGSKNQLIGYEDNYKYDSDNPGFTETYIYDTDGYPIVSFQHYDDLYWTFYYTWEVASSTNVFTPIIPSSKGRTDIYSATGYRFDKMFPGLNIIRTPDGKTRKVLIR